MKALKYRRSVQDARYTMKVTPHCKLQTLIQNFKSKLVLLL